MKISGAALITRLVEQLIRQLRKLEDVIEIHRKPEARDVFATIASLLR